MSALILAMVLLLPILRDLFIKNTAAIPQPLQREECGHQSTSLPTAVSFPTVASSSASSVENSTLPTELSNGYEDIRHSSSRNLGDDTPVQAPDTVDVGRSDSRSTEEVLVSKLQWATRELSAVESVQESTQLCQLIKACAEALKSVRELDTRPHVSSSSENIVR